jgi:hypothetical protein
MKLCCANLLLEKYGYVNTDAYGTLLKTHFWTLTLYKLLEWLVLPAAAIVEQIIACVVSILQMCFPICVIILTVCSQDHAGQGITVFMTVL